MREQTAPYDARDGLFLRLPVRFVDEVLPSLKDTELRVLLVVLRQTDVVEKEVASTWLSHSALCRRTGRASAAVSAAIEGLVHRGLLLVTDENGRTLTTAQERQTASGLRFSPCLRKAKTIDISTSIIYSPQKPKSTWEEVWNLPAPEERKRVEEEKQRIRERLKALSKWHGP